MTLVTYVFSASSDIETYLPHLISKTFFMKSVDQNNKIVLGFRYHIDRGCRIPCFQDRGNATHTKETPNRGGTHTDGTFGVCKMLSDFMALQLISFDVFGIYGRFLD
jgi:hypothetical protein